MSNNPKWEPGAVKLTTGEDAIIKYIQESDPNYRYIGMAHVINGRSFTWKPMAWTVKGLEFPYCTEGSHNLVPPAKRIMRVFKVINVFKDGSSCSYNTVEDADMIGAGCVFARIIVDEQVTEGQGL
jgi:hypothetical protein